MDEISFIDANIFMYAAGASHPYKDSCVRILRDIETENLVAAVNTEIFQELLYRYSHIKLADKGVQLCRELLKYPLTILAVTEADVRLAIDIFEAHNASGLKPRDALHMASMQNNNISRIITADKDFNYLDSIVRIDPIAYV